MIFRCIRDISPEVERTYYRYTYNTFYCDFNIDEMFLFLCLDKTKYSAIDYIIFSRKLLNQYSVQ